MLDAHDALAAATRPVLQTARLRGRVLVVGGAGALGAHVVEHLLGAGRHARVGVLVGGALQPALRGFEPVADDDAALRAFGAGTALVVFDRERHANGRDAVFVRPLPAELLQRAAQLRRAGVQDLLVVVPHTAALLPHALKHGLATLDETAVAALGFDHLVFMRMAQHGAGAHGVQGRPQRLAAWMLSQLKWMVPQGEQALRPMTVARVAATLAAALPLAASGTRVLAPDVLWAAAQPDAADAVITAWLGGHALPAPAAQRRWRGGGR